MYYQFKYQNDDYSINLDKIEYMIKSTEVLKNDGFNIIYILYIFLSNITLSFEFKSKEEGEIFYNKLQTAIKSNETK